MQSNNIPKITTKETEHLRSQYPNLSHLEAGNIAQWLQERKDGLFEMARQSENEADMTRVLGLLAGGIGAVCYAVNPLAVVGGLIGGAAWLWFVVEHSNRTKEIAPIPFVRGNFVDIRHSPQASELSRPTELQSSVNKLAPETLINLPLTNRANALIAALTQSGFQVEDMMSSQVIAIAGTQRGGKGTLAAILATLSLALDSGLNTQYFTAGVDVYPFSCNLISALKYPEKDADGADKLVARDLLKFLKGLDASEPYSHKNLLLVIDEAMRLLSLLDESDRTWAIQYLLSRFAKSGGTLIIVLHGSNLTSVVGKATAGLADTFKQSVNFIGCVAQSVSAGGLRKINVASGEYFKANPNNFAEPVNGGNLGMIPDWLKIELHPGNGQPDPARTLLKFFPELVQHHQPAVMPRGEKIAPSDAVNQLESIFSKPTQDVEIAELEFVSISLADLEQILNIVTSAVATPVSFAAIRNSRKWGEDKKSVRYLRGAIAQLIESKQLSGSEKLGFTAF